MPVPHLGQRDPGRTRDSPRGRRLITTLRKLPTTAPKTAAIKIIPVVPGLSTPQGTPFPTDQGMYRRARRRSLTPSVARYLSLIHISEPTRRTPISYAVFCLKQNTQQQQTTHQ